jgi:hypothetical protein
MSNATKDVSSDGNHRALAEKNGGLGRTPGQAALQSSGRAWRSLYDIALGALISRYGMDAIACGTPELAAKIAAFSAQIADASLPITEAHWTKTVNDRWDEAKYADFEP